MNTKKNVLITGCSSGLGKVVAIEAIKQGYQVFATMSGLNKDTKKVNQVKDELTDTATKANSKVHIKLLDITKDESVAEIVQYTENYGGVDILVNNAGIAEGVSTYGETLSMDQFKKTFEVNVFGVQRMIAAILPSMHKKELSKHNKRGLIINISSTMGRMAFAFSGVYTASKFALEGLTQSYYYQLAGSGIDVCIVEPGVFYTPIWDKIASFQPAYHERAEVYKNITLDGKSIDEYKKEMDGFIQSVQNAKSPKATEVIPYILNLFPETSERPLRTVADLLVEEGQTNYCDEMNKAIDKVMTASLNHHGLSSLHPKSLQHKNNKSR